MTVGYLQQNAFDDDSVTLEDEVKKAFQKILDTKTHLDELLELMENDGTEEIVQEYVDLLELFQNMGGYEYEKEFVMNGRFQDKRLIQRSRNGVLIWKFLKSILPACGKKLGLYTFYPS